MTNYLDNFDWNTLNTMNINEATELSLKTIQYSLDKFAPEKTIHIPYTNIIKQPWMTPALLKSAKNTDILFRKSIGKSNTSKQHTYFIKYSHIYNKLKNISKQTYYNTELNKYKKDVRKTWNIFNTLIGRQHNKIGISEMFKIDNTNITDPNTTPTTSASISLRLVTHMHQESLHQINHLATTLKANTLTNNFSWNLQTRLKYHAS